MRQVVLQMGVTLDGYVAGAGGEGDWGLPAEHPDVRAWKVASLRKVGTHIMGRVTYEQMAGYWPDATGEYADFMNMLPKVVFSRTLPAASSPGCGARGDLTEEMPPSRTNPAARLAHGGTAVCRRVQARLDRRVPPGHPARRAGHGLPLFKDLARPLRVDLAEATSFPDGTAIHA